MATVRHGEITTYYDTFGDPADPTLVLVNGLGSQCVMYRDEWCTQFAATGHRVVRFDNRDMGLSTHHTETPSLGEVVGAVAAGDTPVVPYTVSDMAADAIAVLDDLGVDRAHFLGLSMGGMIVQRTAIDHPHRVHTMTSVMSTTGEPEVGQMSAAAAAHFNRPAASTRDAYVEDAIAGLSIWGSPGHVDEADMRDLYGRAWDRASDPGATSRQVCAVIADGPCVDALRDLRTPSLVMHGSADTLIDPSGGRRTAEVIPGARFHLFDGMGHDYPRSFWDEWVRVWAEFVASHAD